MKWLQRHSETLMVALLGLLVFAVLNYLMTLYAPETWFRPKVGFYSAFHRGFALSGFDDTTYIVVSKWRSLFTELRHPLLAAFLWPLAELNSWLRHEYGINCAVYIVAVAWTLLSTTAWTLLYKTLRRVLALGLWVSVLLTLYFFSFAYVMLSTFAPDHMVLTMTLLVLTLFLAGKAVVSGRTMPVWQALLLFFVATGVTTTNCVKVWLIDIIGCVRRKRFAALFFRRSLLYLIPAALLGGLYLVEAKTVFAREHAFQESVAKKRMAKDSDGKFAASIAYTDSLKNDRESKQLLDNPLFAFTDNTIALWPTLRDNIFGEGLQLHPDYLLQDTNAARRPIFVPYRHWLNYTVEILLVVLFALGVWAGRRERFLWMAMAPFLFDMLLHVGLRFALSDVYIMTAHWAVAMPIAVGYLFKSLERQRRLAGSLFAGVALLTAFLWIHNLLLLVPYLVK